MEREVSDAEGVFSRRLSGNWEELPTTLRRRQKHRPEILSQFADFSESSESEFRKVDGHSFNNVQRIVKRSEFLRRLDVNENVGKNVDTKHDRRTTPDRLHINRLDEDYRRHYDNHETKLGQRRKSLVNLANKFDLKSLSDEDRKTNSPDSLLVKSSESDLSSDEYGHTDDSGAFLEKTSNFDRGTRIEQRTTGFIKFFARDDCNRRKKKLEDVGTTVPTSEYSHFDVNKNNLSESPKALDYIRKDSKKDFFSNQQRFEYENIPRVDVSKLDQKTFLNQTSTKISDNVSQIDHHHHHHQQQQQQHQVNIQV